MGSVCQKAPLHAEPELEIAQVANQDHSEYKTGVSADLERQFLKTLEEISIPEGPFKEKLAQLRPFEFDTTRDSSALTIVKANELTEGEIYFGFWDPIQNFREYKGVIQYKDGGYFMGHFARGTIQGKGRKVTPDLAIYEGDFVAGQEEGKGTLTHPDGSTYEGEWKAGNQEGTGVEDIPGKQRYEGGFKNGLKHGKGVCKWADGAVYEGDFVEGKHEGEGKYTRANGKVYEGQWKDGRENGKGTLKYPEGMTYTGEFANGVPHGIGKLQWDDGSQVMEGSWVQGKQEGRVALIIPGKAPQYVEMKAGQIVSVIGEVQA